MIFKFPSNPNHSMILCIVAVLAYLPVRKKRQNHKKSGESRGTIKVKGQNLFNG